MDKIDQTLLDINLRLAEVERRLQIIPPRTTAPASPSPAPRPAQPRPVTATPPAPQGTSGSLFGLVGIVFLILGTISLVELTIQSGWLTPWRQVSLAAAFGLVCLLLPHILSELADDYGALLSGAGAAILHVTWFGAFEIHHLIDAHQALLCSTIVGVLAILLNARMGNAVFVMIAVAGTYVSAGLIGYSGLAIQDLTGFLLVWNVSFCALGFLCKRRDLVLIAAFFAVFTVAFLYTNGNHADDGLTRSILFLQGIQFAIFAGSMALFSLVFELPMTSEESWGSCVLLLFYYAHVFSLLDRLYPDLAPWFGVALSVLVLALYAAAEKAIRVRLESTSAILTFAALVLLHSAFLKLTPDAGKPAVALVLGLALALGARKGVPAVWRVPCFILGAAVVYGVMESYSPTIPTHLAILYHFAYGAAALGLVAAALDGTAKGRQLPAGSLLLTFAHIEMLSALYQLSDRPTVVGGSLFVSLSWGAYALAVLAWGYLRRERLVGQSAVLILGAVSLKAAFYDLLLSGRSGSSVLCLFLAGVLLYACGGVFRKMQSW